MTGLQFATRSSDSSNSVAYTPMRLVNHDEGGMADGCQENGDANVHADSNNCADVDHMPCKVNVHIPIADSTPKVHGRCRWGPISPACCQGFRKPVWMLVCLCFAGFVQGMVVNGFINVIISTLERRFQISSTESGTIASCYDIAAVVFLIPVTYFGGRGRKPVYLSVGFFILGIGAFTFALPHFIVDPYDFAKSGNLEGVCEIGYNVTACAAENVKTLSNFKYVFFLGQLLHGAGAAPLYTLGVTYLDDNLPVRSTSLYQGIFYAFAIFGPGTGYLLGGAFLSIYTDFNRVDVDTINITSDNPRWVGAWWIGFLVGGVIAVLVAVPLFGFPKTLPGSEFFQEEKNKEVFRGKEVSDTAPLGFEHIVKLLKQQLTNPTFMFLNVAAACEGGIVSGFSTFAPKYIESQFGLSSGFAAQIVGLVAIPAGGGGTFCGGWLVKRFDWDIPRILRFCLIVTVATLFLGFIFFINCDDIPFAGITMEYQHPITGTPKFLGTVKMDSSCNQGCGCSLFDYNPVCGRDQIMYYSPCYAGCRSPDPLDIKKYGNCSCLAYNFTAEDKQKNELWGVQEGKCESSCVMLPLFMPIFGLVMIGIFITSMPALTATLRCVAQDERSFALGVQWVIARCIGSIPGPVLFGKAIDLTCRQWQTSCDGEGACMNYDNQQMSYNLLAVGIAYNLSSCICFFFALKFYRPHLSSTSLAVSELASQATIVEPLSHPPTPGVQRLAAKCNGHVTVPSNGQSVYSSVFEVSAQPDVAPNRGPVPPLEVKQQLSSSSAKVMWPKVSDDLHDSTVDDLSYSQFPLHPFIPEEDSNISGAATVPLPPSSSHAQSAKSLPSVLPTTDGT